MAKIYELSEKQDSELVELLKNSSQQAFGELYFRFRERLMYLCKRCLKNEADAEDVVHDVFLRLWETRHSLNAELSFSGYVQTIAQNFAINKLKHLDVHSRFARNILMTGTDSTNETDDTIINNDYTALLLKLIESLPPRQKEIFTLSHLKGLTHKEIAELLHIPTANVKKYASLASKKIKKQLIQHADIHLKTLIALLILLS